MAGERLKLAFLAKLASLLRKPVVMDGLMGRTRTWSILYRMEKQLARSPVPALALVEGSLSSHCSTLDLAQPFSQQCLSIEWR